METYLFYTTHLIMVACIAVIASAGKPEIIQAAVKQLLSLAASVSPLRNLKAIYHPLIKERKFLQALIINALSIAIQIYNQLLR